MELATVDRLLGRRRRRRRSPTVAASPRCRLGGAQSATRRADRGRSTASATAFVPRDQPRETVGPVFGLEDHVDRGELGGAGAVGDDDHLRRPGERRRAHRRLRRPRCLRDRDIDVARSDDHVDRPDRSRCRRRWRAIGLGPADGDHLVDAGDRSRGQGDVGDAPVGARRHTRARPRGHRRPSPEPPSSAPSTDTTARPPGT